MSNQLKSDELYRQAAKSGLYDFNSYVRTDKEARDLAREATEELKKLYSENPEPLDSIATYYVKLFLQKLMAGEINILTSHAAYTQAKEAYPSFTFSEDMFIPVTEREKMRSQRKKKQVLKDFHVTALLDHGNTIVSKQYTKEQIKKEAKRRANLTVHVIDFRVVPDVHFWLVETDETYIKKESKEIKIK